ncbi:MAG TPA: hypothetical protein VNR67_04670 [Solirubrobacterales bacterium]|nr:hypothetical protein [Solirubrobacterales bacterium]
MSVDAAYAELAAERGLEQLPGFDPGQLTPLLVEAKGAGLQPALRGALGEGVPGVVGQLAYRRNKTFRFQVALTEVPAATAFAPRVFCIRRGRSTRDDEFYGFEARHSKLWTESMALNERYEVATSPFQDPNWLRQLFSPSFVDWLGTEPPADFSFELAYGALLGSVESDDPDAGTLAALCEATARVATRVREECEE